MLAEQWFSSRRPVVSVEEKLGIDIFHVEFPQGPATPAVDFGRQPA
jgi:hypothetical protein